MSQPSSRFDAAVKMFKNSSGMTDAEAEVYVRRFLEGHSRSQVADSLSKSESTVDTQHQSAKKKAQLPSIDRVMKQGKRNTGSLEGEAYEIWLSNRSMFRFVWHKEHGEIYEDTIAADDPDSFYSRHGVGGDKDELAEFAMVGIEAFTRQYRDDPETCRSDAEELFEAVTLYDS